MKIRQVTYNIARIVIIFLYYKICIPKSIIITILYIYNDVVMLCV